MDGTPDEDVIVFNDLDEQTSPLQTLFSWERLFLKISLSAIGWLRVSSLRYMSRITTHAGYGQVKELVYIFVLVLGSRALEVGPFCILGT